MKTYNKPEFQYIDLKGIDVLMVSAENFGDFNYGFLTTGGKML